MLDRKGQGLVEYILLIVLIALVAIVGMQAFGRKVRSVFTKVANRIAGTMDVTYSDSGERNDDNSGSVSRNIVDSVMNLSGGEEFSPSKGSSGGVGAQSYVSSSQQPGSSGVGSTAPGIAGPASVLSNAAQQKRYKVDEYIDVEGYTNTLNQLSNQAVDELSGVINRGIANARFGNEQLDNLLSSFKPQLHQWVNQQAAQVKKDWSEGNEQIVKDLHQKARKLEDKINNEADKLKKK